METPAAPQPSTRSFAIDALKGFAITCVVMGHALLRTVSDPSDNALYLLLSAFEMPLFMFLSGYVLPGRVRGSRVAWVGNRAIRLMIPFFAWHAIFFLSRQLTAVAERSAAQVVTGLMRYLWVTFANPTAGLWYLPSLLLCSIVLAVFLPLRERPLILAAVGWVSVAASLWLLQSAGVAGDFGLKKTATYWLFFAAGYAWATWGKSLQPAPPLVRWAPALIYPLVAVPVMRAMPVLGVAGSGAAKVALGLAGTGFSAVLLEMAAPVARWLRLDRLGRLTLGVYCSQWLFLRVEFASGAAGVLASFGFTLAASILTTMAIGKLGPLKGVLLGEWPRRVKPVRESA